MSDIADVSSLPQVEFTRERQAVADEAAAAGRQRYCAYCGGRLGLRDEVVQVAPIIREQDTVSTSTGRVYRAPANRGRELWDSVHASCAELSTPDLVRLLSGRHDLSDAEAEEVRERAGVAIVARDEDPTKLPAKPWAWVPEASRTALERAARVVVQRLRGGGLRCQDGPCAMCGVERSSEWSTGPGYWRSGRTVQPPLCRECGDRWDRAGSPQNPEHVRVLAVELMTKMPLRYGFDDCGMQIHADLPDHRDCPGHSEPWSYSPGLAAVRERAYRRSPDDIPDPRDREAVMTILESEWLAEQQEIAAERAEVEPVIRW